MSEDQADDTMDEPSSAEYPFIPEGDELLVLAEEFPTESEPISDRLKDLTDQVRRWRGTMTERFALLEFMLDLCICKLLGVFDQDAQTRLSQVVLTQIQMGKKITILDKLVKGAELPEQYVTMVKNVRGANDFRNFLAHAVGPLSTTGPPPRPEDEGVVIFTHRARIVHFPVGLLAENIEYTFGLWDQLCSLSLVLEPDSEQPESDERLKSW